MMERIKIKTEQYSSWCFLLLASLFFFSQSYAKNKTNPEIEANVKSWMKSQKPIGFSENKGQFTLGEGKPATFVLFKAETHNMNIWVTTTGLTYQFLKFEEEEKKTNKGESVTDAKKEDDVVNYEWSRTDMILKNASIEKENVVAEGEVTQGAVSYYFQHCPNGAIDVKSFTKITIKEVYKGIDWVLYTSASGGLKYDFVVHPQADPNQIKLVYEGNGKFGVKENQIHFENELGVLNEERLLCYQGAEKTVINSNYVTKKNIHPLYLSAGTLSPEETTRQPFCRKKGKEKLFSYEVSIDLKEYNTAETLIIDPQLTWATFYGGTGADGPMSVDCDANNNVYVTGYTDNVSGITFPLQAWGGAYFYSAAGYMGIFVMRFDPNGALIWSTFYGPGRGHSIVCDAAGAIYITGYTRSGFPTYNPGGGAYYQSVGGFNYDAFILKFDNAGNRLWATYYGGASDEEAYSITLDGSGNIYVVGYTNSDAITFPLQSKAGAYNQGVRRGFQDAFILRFTNSGVLNWATYYGGDDYDQAYAITTDSFGNIYVTGYTTSSELTFPLQSWGSAYFDNTFGGSGNGDIFILRFTNTGSLTWSTYYGGTGNDRGTSIACDASDNVYVVGYSNSTAATFATQTRAGAYNQGANAGGVDAVILCFTSLGVCTWATFYGGSNTDTPYYSYHHLEIDDCGNLYLSLNTMSSNIYTIGTTSCGNFYDSSYGGSLGSYGDSFIIKFSDSGAVLWATYLGGNGTDFREPIALDNNGNLFVVGEWCAGSGSINTGTYPLTNPGGSTYFDNTFGGLDDGFIVKFSPVVPTITQSQINSTSCSPCNGSATVNIACANPNFNYTWSNGSQTLSSSISTNTITGLCPGNYSVTVTDSACVIVPYIATFVITGTACGSLTVNVNSVTICSGAVPCPTLTTNAASGTQPYTYSWSTSASTQNINPCPTTTTTYTVKVTDAGGATSTSTAVVTVNPAVTVSATSTNITCNGTSTGSVTATPAGGTPTFNYVWNNGITTPTGSNLAAGNYTVTVIDSKGCTAVSTTTITAPPALLGQFSKGTANCSTCGCKEWIMLNATGGISPYAYTWPDGYDKRYKNALCPGVYNVIVTDNNGCKTTVKVNAP